MKFKIALAVIAVLLGVILNIYYRQQVPDGLASGEERALRMLGVLVTVIRKMVSESASSITSLCFCCLFLNLASCIVFTSE